MTSFGDITKPSQRPGWSWSTATHAVAVVVGKLQFLRESERIGNVDVGYADRHVGRWVAAVRDAARRCRLVLDEHGVASWLDSVVVGHHLTDDDKHSVDWS